MKHTPGPWSLCRDGACRCKIVSGEHYPVATVESGEWGDEYPSIRLVGPSLDRKAEAYMERIGYGKIPEDVAIANGRLIAAAPELLEACKIISGMYVQDIPPDHRDYRAIMVVRAAISKAAGTRVEVGGK